MNFYSRTLLGIFALLLSWLLHRPCWAQNPSQPELVIQRGHTGEISAMAITQDGKYLASSSYGDQTIKLWDLSAGKELRSFPGWSVKLRFSSDGTKIASYCYGQGGWVGEYNRFDIWDISSGKIQSSFRVGEYNSCGAICPNAGLVAVALNNSLQASYIRLTSSSSGSKLVDLPVQAPKYLGLDMSADGSKLVSGDENKQVTLWDIAKQKKLETFEGHESAIAEVQFSPDAKKFASRDNAGIVMIYDTQEEEKIREITMGSPYGHICFSNSGDQFAFVRPAEEISLITIVDIASGRSVAECRYSGLVRELLFTADDKLLIGGTKSGDILFWDSRTGERRKTLTRRISQLDQVAFNLDGGLIGLKDSQGDVKVFQFPSGRLIRLIKDSTSAVQMFEWDRRGITVATLSENGSVKLWDLSRESPPRTVVVPYTSKLGLFPSLETQRAKLFYCSDGRTMFSPYGDGHKSATWNVETGERVRLFDFSPDTHSSDGKLVSAAIGRESYQIFDVLSGRAISTIHLPNGLSHGGVDDFSPDNKIALTHGLRSSYPSGGTIVSNAEFSLIEIESGKVIKSILTNRGYISSAKFDPSGTMVAITSSDKPVVTVWDTKTMRLEDLAGGHDGQINSLAFSPDGNTCVTAGNDGKAVYWRVPEKRKLGTLFLVDDNDWVFVDSEERFEGTEKGIRLVSYVQGLSILPLQSLYDKFHSPGILGRSIGRK